METVEISFYKIKSHYIDLVNFISETCSIKKNEISLKKAFYQDFGIYGDDWNYFIEDFEKKFRVNFAGLDYDKYFPEEGIHMLFLPKPKRKKLTVGDVLATVICEKFILKENLKINYKL